MPDQQPDSYLRACALAHALASCGLEHVVISPGSRSTALVIAFHEASSIQKHIVLDERSAAFIALGMARATKRPAALVCTSGTAAANYFPAVIEARQSGIPLLLITADRSAIDRSNGAPQSMDQTHLFGRYPVFYFDASAPATKTGLQRLRYAAWQATDAAIRQQGPAHINIPFDKPFEPTATLPVNTEETVRPVSHLAYPVVSDDDLPDMFYRAKRPVIVAGPDAGRHLTEAQRIALFDQIRIPILAEHSSGFGLSPLQQHRVSGFPWKLRPGKENVFPEPDLIIRLGLTPVSKALEYFLEKNRHIPEIYFAAHPEWASPHHPSGYRFAANPSVCALQKLQERMDASWPLRWETTDESASVFDAFSHLLTDPGVHRAVQKALPDQDFLWISNSLPIRDIDLAGQSWHSDGHPIYSARGVSGIDGITSQAIGTVLASGRNGTLMTGDLAFLHDTNALLSASKMAGRLSVIVINNGGGRIFSMLPVASRSDVFETYFGTPQKADIGMLCNAYGVYHERISAPGDLHTGLEKVFNGTGIRVLECCTHQAESEKLREALWKLS